MASANKTTETAVDVDAWLDGVDEPRRSEGRALVELFSRVTGEPPRMWGPSIIGFGSYHYRYESGHEGDAARVGFSPRKAELSLYLLADFPEKDALLARLGKHKVGKACLYIRRLSDADPAALEALIRASWDHMAKQYPA